MNINTKSPHAPQHAPHKLEISYYGYKYQWEKNDSNKPIILPEDIKYIQNVVGDFPYYERAVDPTMMVAFGAFVASQSK